MKETKNLYVTDIKIDSESQYIAVGGHLTSKIEIFARQASKSKFNKSENYEQNKWTTVANFFHPTQSHGLPPCNTPQNMCFSAFNSETVSFTSFWNS